MNRTNRSRLYKQNERRSKNSLLINLIAIIVVIFLVVKFGIPILINSLLFISGSKNSKDSIKNENTFIAPPILNPMPSATNSAQITVSGTSIANDKIEIFINDSKIDEKKPEKDGNFSFDISLPQKENTIKAKAVKDKKESDFSAPINISFVNSAPTLKISSPSDGDSFSKDQNSVEVKGETDAFVKITVNDFWAITDQSNHFSYILPLKNGENQIKITAVDQAGNKTEKTIKVTYNP